jgi:molecular chaperone HscC
LHRRTTIVTTIIGIDLGTTYSVAAHLTPDGPRIIPNALGEALTPSIVGIDDDKRLLVGKAAKEFQVVRPERCASVFKRYMGTDWTTTLGGQKFTPEELSSLVLRSLKDDAAAHLGQPVERAVITVPAYFNDQQRKATINAGRIAGLTVERIVNEPTAAAMAYGFHDSRDEKMFLIFDLGGGTFDVSLVELFDGVLEVKASSGETFLGGEDFTQTLAARVLELHGMPFERTEMAAPKLVSRMMWECEIAKCKLSSQDSVSVRIPDRDGDLTDKSPQATVTREQFQTWTAHILERVEGPVRRVLRDAGVRPGDVNEVILVGGATRMPAVVQRVEQIFSKAPQCRLNPDEVVGLGASVQAGLVGRDQSVEDLVVTDVAPFTLGMEITKKFGSELRNGYFLPVIHRNTTIPASRVEQLATIAPNQTEIAVKLYQGESRRVEENLFLGEFTLKGVPLGPAGQPVEIRFTYDLNGVLEVEATVLQTRQKTTHVVTRYARGLSANQIADAVRSMAKLKTHPREETANRLLLRRAERTIKELGRPQREFLNQLLDGFEEALALRDPEAIERHRAVLASYLDEFDSTGGIDAAGDDDDSPL